MSGRWLDEFGQDGEEREKMSHLNSLQDKQLYLPK